MLKAPVQELTRLKTLISQNAMYYKGDKQNRDWDFGDETWDEATGDRYLNLAEKNYEHFSPGARASQHGTNKSEWERYHKLAIEAAQQAFLSHPNASVFPERALIINAFGDHFLTDAFASGHLINKDEALDAFRANFYSGGDLKPSAERFFEKVANLAFKGEVRKRFSVLETYKAELLWWNPNIDTVNAFRKLLLRAAVEKRDAVANIAVKALHDKLNKEGIDVVNDAGERWHLMGDDYLLAGRETLTRVKKAVRQSIDNINDPAIQASNLNFLPFFQRVWKFVPRPAPGAGAQKLTRLMAEYTDPLSDTLATDAAGIITRKVDSIIKRLLKEKYLQYA
jgi:Ni/Co efflux regulator RcnB